MRLGIPVCKGSEVAFPVGISHRGKVGLGNPPRGMELGILQAGGSPVPVIS